MLHFLLAVCTGYASVCCLFLAANLLVLPRMASEPAAGDDAPFLSFVVPARNEERGIEEAMRSLLAQQYRRFEVVVVDDRSTDGTPAILARLAAADARLTVVAGVEPPAGWIGKPHALYQGAHRARGELLLFVDADVCYRPDAAALAVGFLLRKRADFVAILPRLQGQGFWEPVLMANLACAIYLGPGFLANADRPRWIAAGGGAGNLVRRSVYDAAGGHEAIRSSVIDDVRLAVQTKRAGYRVRAVVAVDHVAVRMYRGLREVWNGFTKNAAYALGGWTGFAFLLLSLLWTVVSVIPPAVLLAALAGVRLAPGDVVLAAASWALIASARAILAAYVREPLWTAGTQPIMAAVWAGILVRSIFHRLVRRELRWRGRSFDARKVGF